MMPQQQQQQRQQLSSGSSPFMTGTSAPASSSSPAMQQNNAFATGWNGVNVGPPSLGVPLGADDPWSDFGSNSANTAAKSGTGASLSTAADDDWDQFLNL
jgi:hypothetical protein